MFSSSFIIHIYYECILVSELKYNWIQEMMKMMCDWWRCQLEVNHRSLSENRKVVRNDLRGSDYSQTLCTMYKHISK